jgi:Carboxypeptidase regulatory-like domain/Prenyltransferase and squalene oxidase repeat
MDVCKSMSWFRITLAMVPVCFCAFLGSALARAGTLTPEQQRGIAWLSAQVQSDGSLANEGASIATPLQAREESALTLRALATVPGALAAAVAGNSEGNTEYAARRILLAVAAGQSAGVDEEMLLAAQNPDGGWGFAFDYQSDALDTEVALQALAATNGGVSAAASGLAFLSNARLADGGWGVAVQSNVYFTANALLAANAWSSQGTASSSIASAATNWLLTTRNATEAYGDSFEDSVALLALSRQPGQSSALQPLMTALTSRQLVDGSWGDDPYLTALALRGLWLAGQVPIIPTTGNVIGVVVDMATSQPLPGASITLAENAGINAVTDANGNFRLSGVPAAIYTLEIARTGYQSRSASIDVVAGQTLNLGSIPLAAISTTAKLSGVVKGNNGQPLQNVIVAVGTKSTLTDGTGAYEIVGIGPGAATITATLSGYKTVSASVSFVAGTTYLFAPTMYPSNITPPPTSVRGVVVDGKTGMPIAGASVVLNNSTQTTGADGSFVFAAATTGAYIGTISAGRYQSVTFSLSIVAGINDIGSVTMQPLAPTTTFHGFILDSQGNPISNATLAVAGGPIATSDDSGAYELDDLTGTQFAITVSALGYVEQTFVFGVSAPGNYAQDFQLVAEVVSNVTLGPLTVAPETAGANTNISVSSTIVNGGAAQFEGELLLEVYDSADNLVGSGPLTDDGGFSLGAVSLQPSESLGIIGRWNTGQFAPGAYKFELRLVQANSINRAVPLGVLLQDQFASFSITSTTHFTGTVAGDPPVVQAGLNQAVHFTGVIKNDGNVALAARPMTLTVADAKSGAIAFTAVADIDLLESNALATPDFGGWIPAVGGNYKLTITAANPTVGSISGSLYVGNAAQVAFTVNPDTVVAGTRIVHGNIHVTGVDPAQATITDPLAPLIRSAIQNAITYNDTAAHTWVDTNRCTSCHISNQALIGGELTRRLTTFNRLDRLAIINNVATNQATDGSITEGWTTTYHKRLGSMTLWGLLGYHDKLELQTVYKHAADWLVSVQNSSGEWVSDYKSKPPYPVTWFDDDISMSLLNLSSLRRTEALLSDNAITAVPFYAGQTLFAAAPASSRGFLIASADGGFYYTDRTGSSADLIRSDGTLVRKWTGFTDPRSIVQLPNGDTWLSSSSGTFQLNPDGTTKLLASDNMVSLAIDSSGTVWGIKSGDTKGIYRLDASGKASQWLANGPFTQVGRIVPDDDGTLYVTDFSNGRIYQVMPDKSVSVVTEVIQGDQKVPALIYLLKDGDHWLLSTSNGIYRFSADWVGHRIAWSRADQMARLVDGSVGYVSYQQAGIRKLVLQTEDVSASLTNYAAAMSRGTTWLQSQSIVSTDNMHMAQQLWGLGEAYRYYKPADPARAASIYAVMKTLASQLRANQAADGGWGKVKGNASDALVTAQTGIALDYLDPSASDPAIRRAVAWLLSQQHADGSWISADGIMTTHESTTTMVAIWLPMILDRLGAIDAQVSVAFPTDVQSSSFDPAPTQMTTDGAGNVLATWSLTGVTNAGVDLGFDLTLTDLQPDEVRPVATDAHMTFNNSFNEQTVNQPIPIPDVTALAPVTLEVVTDHPDYPANATAMVTTTLDNLDDIAIDGTLVVNVYDHAGVFVGGVTQRDVSIPAGGTLPVSDPFFIGTIVPAQYTVRAVLSNNGRVLAQGQTTFNVLPDNASAAATSTVHTDKQVYNPSDQVQILSRVESVSANTVLNDLSLQVKVFDSANVLKYSHTYAIAQLLVGQTLDFTGIEQLSNAAPGLYSVKQDLFDGGGNLFNHVEAAYNVSSTADTGFGLVGTIAAVPKSLRLGLSVMLNAAATNNGNSALTDLPLTISIIDPDDGTVLDQLHQTSTLPVGATVPFDPNWVTKGTPNKTYYAVLTATIGSGDAVKTLTLAVDTFEVTLKLDVDLTLKATKPPLAALVLIDPDAPAGESAQVLAALTTQNYAATLVSTPEDFAAGVRSGAYQFYLLLAAHVAPDATTLRLLREAVHRGEGVLSANGVADLPDALAQITGLTGSNALPVINAQSIDVLASTPGGAAHVDLDPAWPSRIVVPQVAQTQAVLTGRLPSVPEQGTLSDEVAALGRVDIGYYGSDAGTNDTQLSLASVGRIRDAEGNDAFTVWRIRNSGDTPRNVNLGSVDGDYLLPLTVASHSDAFLASPVVAGAAQHQLIEATQTIQTAPALTSVFSDSRLVDVGDNPGAIALWANEIGMTDVLDWTGSQHVVHGAVHSNSDIRLAGAQNLIDGPVHYVTTLTNSGSQNTFTFQPRQVGTQPLPTLLNLDDFRPGGPVSSTLGPHYIDASDECATSHHGWQRNASQMPLARGVYWIPCDVHISGGNGTQSNITLVSTGAMQIDGVKGVFEPFYQGLQFATTSQSAGALQLSGDATQVGGLVFAPNGTVKISGSSLSLQCSVIGNEIRFANAKTTIDARDCPYATVQRKAPAVLLNAFGEGWAAYSAFDWPGAIAQYESAGPGELTSLFGTVLGEIAPTQNPLRAGTVVPLKVTVQNLFDPFTGQLSLQANDDSSFIPLLTNWNLDFTQQSDFEADSNVRLGSSSSSDVTASISVSTPIVQDLLKQTSATITHLSGESINDLIAAVSAVNGPDAGLTAALADLQAAQVAWAVNDREGALGHLLDAAEALGSSTNAAADDLRTRADWVIWATTH